MDNTNMLCEVFDALSLCDINEIRIDNVRTEKSIATFDLNYEFTMMYISTKESMKKAHLWFKDIREAFERCELIYNVGSNYDPWKHQYYRDNGIDVFLIPKFENGFTYKNLRCTIIFINHIKISAKYFEFKDTEPITFLRGTLGYQNIMEDHREKSYSFYK